MQTATVLVYERGERGEGCPLLHTQLCQCSDSVHTGFELELRLAYLHNVCNTVVQVEPLVLILRLIGLVDTPD